MVENIEREGTPASQNILQQVGEILSPLDASRLHHLYEAISTDPYVRGARLTFTTAQLRQYFEQMRRGLVYMRNAYGDGSLPGGIEITSDFEVLTPDEMSSETLTDFILYDHYRDLYRVSRYNVAEHAACIDNPNALFSSSHIPVGYGVSAADFVILEAIEESYHRYQSRQLGYVSADTRYNRGHPHEIEVDGVIARALPQVGVQLRLVPEKGRLHRFLSRLRNPVVSNDRNSLPTGGRIIF